MFLVIAFVIGLLAVGFFTLRLGLASLFMWGSKAMPASVREPGAIMTKGGGLILRQRND
ncbi:hypothetical protein M8P87_11110 [Pseudomonas stutzeri]|uniref:hypothetical protein n=1 Tax=Stutzerimonas stutzeri TaxID=316 RepID=UPI001559F1A3|nr:hypothetical protein [Stutzerimonas stutzeri]MCQ4230402.1 hypothetical protein [Stutzerimonas stutzeri]